MYNDGVITTEFTGYYDNVAQEYVYPDAHQNFIVVFDDFYLSAEDGDFTTDGVTISTQIGDSEDITIGNAPAAVLNATMLNPDGLMDSLTWGYGLAAIGVVTGTAAADTYSSLPCYVLSNTHHFGITAAGGAVHDSTTVAVGGKPKAVIVHSDGTAYYFTSTGIAYWNGSAFSTPTTTAALTFLADKFADREEPIGIECDSNGCPAVWNDVANDTKTTYTYVPMGIFDFSNVDAFGMTFVCEAYDKMTLFDADATDWVQNLDYTSPKTMSTLISELMTEMGLTAVVSGTAVNTSMAWSANPITSYSVTYRQVLKWISEAIGCNARISRTGQVVFYRFPASSSATIRQDVIIGNTRTKGRDTVPQVTELVCYNTVGAGYSVGSTGSTYFIVANPYLDPSSGTTQISNILTCVDDVPTYYATSIADARYDPRIDCGDFITLNDPDGLTTYTIPVMHQTIVWNNVTKATVTATGKQVRSIPTSMLNTDLSGVVSSNPAAVVNMIQAHGIDADWITAGTISDRFNRNSWDLDSGDLNITTGKIQTTYTKTYYYADYDASDITRITGIRQGNITPTDADYEKYDIIGVGQINLATQNRVQQIINTQTNLVKTVTTVIDPSAYEYAIKITTSVPAVGTAQAFNYSTLYSGPKIKAYTYEGSMFKGGFFQGTEVDLYDGTYSKNITASGPTPTTESDSTSVASDTSWHSIKNFTISSPGTYLISIHANFPSNSTGRRQMILSTSQDSSSAVARRFMESKNAVNGTATYLNLTSVVAVSASTTYYINVQQNSGSSMTVTWEYSYVRLA